MHHSTAGPAVQNSNVISKLLPRRRSGAAPVATLPLEAPCSRPSQTRPPPKQMAVRATPRGGAGWGGGAAPGSRALIRWVVGERTPNSAQGRPGGASGAAWQERIGGVVAAASHGRMGGARPQTCRARVAVGSCGPHPSAAADTRVRAERLGRRGPRIGRLARRRHGAPPRNTPSHMPQNIRATPEHELPITVRMALAAQAIRYSSMSSRVVAGARRACPRQR